MAAGGSLGVCCLALVLTIPAILDAHDGRAAARALPGPPPPARRARPSSWNARTRTGSKAFTRIFVAPGTAKDTAAAAPPGAAPGSPPRRGVRLHVHDLLRAEPALKGLLPGTEKGLIGGAGLTDPDELYAYVGTTRAELAHKGRAFAGFDLGYAPTPAVDPSTLAVLRFALATLVLLPWASSSPSAPGSPPPAAPGVSPPCGAAGPDAGTQRVNAAETVVAALFGALLGLGESRVLNQVMSRTGLPDLKWYPADGALSASTIAICLLGCPALAWFVGRASARTAAAKTAGRTPPPPSRAPRRSGAACCSSPAWASSAATA